MSDVYAKDKANANKQARWLDLFESNADTGTVVGELDILCARTGIEVNIKNLYDAYRNGLEKIQELTEEVAPYGHQE